MKSQRLLFFLSLQIFYIQPTRTIAKPIVGVNVREPRANEMEFSAVVSIVSVFNTSANNEQQFQDDIICSGTLISLVHVVTAEHCAQGTRNHRIEVIAGSIDIRLGCRYPLFWWVTHNQWAVSQLRRNRYTVNDISVIKLLGQVHGSIVPAVLSNLSKKRLVGASATMAGWGKLNNEEIPMIIHVANVTILSDFDCLAIHHQFYDFTYHMPASDICSVNEPYVLLEHGDSGGPLLQGNVIVGVNLGTFPFHDMGFHPELANIHVTIHYYRVFLSHLLNN
ncbi:PREDICTED: trypsin delta/gamma-like [Ceratosolen solmsi marchali]|uniref:Trypsin delta/gamma-like n=1 Tax=Ceratosolen solmsi marchali TaxID=326594 RepID=A0AAJ6YHW6_9HYME|nr:PREDICTED: trypsin delta/gamma-like [Ceratosolen solmsi marchali]